MRGYITVREASQENKLGKSTAWIRAAIRLKKIEAEIIGPKLYIISNAEINRIKKNPITITREEFAESKLGMDEDDTCLVNSR